MIELRSIDAVGIKIGFGQLVIDIVEVAESHGGKRQPLALAPQIAQEEASHHQEAATHQLSRTSQILRRVGKQVDVCHIYHREPEQCRQVSVTGEHLPDGRIVPDSEQAGDERAQASWTINHPEGILQIIAREQTVIMSITQDLGYIANTVKCPLNPMRK